MKDNLKKILKDKKSLCLMGYAVFLIAVFVVGNIAIPGAAETVRKMVYAPANSNFKDDALYSCVIDAYNKEHSGAHMTESSNLTDAQLESIKTLECPGLGIQDVTGIDKMTGLETLDLSNNEITSLISSNTDSPIFASSQSFKTIILDNNEISGGNHYIYALENLEHLSLKHNHINAFFLGRNNSLRSDIWTNTKLTYLDISYNEFTNLDTTLATDLKELYVNNNQLKQLDLSYNTKLDPAKTDISNNSFESELYVYSRGSRQFYLQNPVELPSALQSGTWNITWSLPENEVASIDSSNKITALNAGDVTATGTSAKYSVNCDIHSIEITSNNSKYKISDDKYIWVGSDIAKSKEEIISNLNQGPVKANNIKYVLQSQNSSDLINQEVNLVVSNSYTNQILAEIPVYGATSTSDIYNMDSKYIYNDYDSSVMKISSGLVLAGTPTMMAFVDSRNNIVKSYNRVKYTSDKFDISIDKDYVWVDTEEQELYKLNDNLPGNDPIEVQNGSMSYNTANHKLTLKDGDKAVIKTWDVIGWSSNKYDLGGEMVNGIPMSDGTIITKYVNIKGETIDPFSSNIVDKLNANINFTVDDASIQRVTDRTGRIQYFNVERDGKVILKFDLVSFNSSKYSDYMNKDYIDVGNGNLDKTAFEGTEFSAFAFDDSGDRYMYEKDDVLSVMRVTSDNVRVVYKNWDIVRYSSDKYDLSKDYISIGANDTFDTINASINKANVVLVPVTGANGLEQIQIRYKTSDGPLIKTLSIVSYSSDYYDLSKSYIFTGTESIDFIKSKFNLTGSHLDLEGNKLKLKVDNEEGTVIKTWNLVRCSSDHYYINKDYIFYKDSSRDYRDGDITITSDNATVLGVENKQLRIKQKDNTIIELPKVYVDSDTYNLNNDYIYLGPNKTSVDDIKLYYNDQHVDFSHGISVKYNSDHSKMYIVSETGKTGEDDYKYDVMKTVNIVSVVSDEYEIMNNAIFVLDANFDSSKVRLNHTGTGYSLSYSENNKEYTLSNRSGILNRWRVVTVKSDKYDISDKFIDTKGADFEESNVNTNGHKVYNEDTNILKIIGTTADGSSYKEFKVVKYNSDTYDLSKNYINIKTGEFNKNLINIPSDCTKEVVGGPSEDEYRFVIKYQGEVVKSWDIVGYKYTSDKYNNQLEDGYLFFDNDQVTDQLNTYNCTARISNDVLKFKLNNSDEYLEEEYPILKYTSTKYDLTKNYINFPDENVNDLYENVTFNNNDLRFKDYDGSGYIFLYYKNKEVKRWYYTSYSSNKYDLSKSYIFMTGATPLDHITNNKWYIEFAGSSIYKSVNLRINQSGSIIRTWDVISIYSSDYKIGGDYIYIGTNDNLDVDKIVFVNNANSVLDKRVNENGDLEIVDNNEIIKTFKTIKSSSTVYDLSKPYIAASGKVNTMFNTNADSVVVDKQDNKVKLMYNDEVVKTWDLLLIESEKYYVSDNYIYIGDQGFSEENLTLINMRLKQINDTNNNGILGDVGDVVVFENTTSGYNYEISKTISNDYIDFDNLDVVNNVIKNIKEDTTISEFTSKIHTTGTVVVKDSTGHEVTDNRALRTGDTVCIRLSDMELTYKIAVKGDVSGNGVIDLTDVIQLYQHEEGIVIIPDTEQYRLMAGDVNNDGIGDGVIDLSDVIRLFQYTNGDKFPDNSTYFITFIVKNISKIGGIA